MQIGEKVRFLNEVGGGVIAGFQGKDVVLVEDEDGFKIPMLRSQIVVVETNPNNFVRKSNFGAQPSAPASQPSAPAPQPSRPKERQGGDLLNVCLAFVPEDSRELSNTRFEAYIINDSNYFVSAVVANNENAAWHTRWQGTLEPNTKQLLESFDRSILNDLQRLSVQLIVWKQDKPFLLKAPVGVELRLDTVKFYKLHVFRPSPFFREPALIYDIVRGDKPVRRLLTADEEDSPRTGRGKELFVEEEDALDLDLLDEDLEEVAAEVDEAPVPIRTREEEREALKAAKRALKAEQQARAAKQAKSSKNPKNAAAEETSFVTAAPIEVDLHIDALLDNTAGFSPNVLLNTQLTEFRIIMDRNIKKKGQRLYFLHGKGEVNLREALIKELNRRYRTCTYEDASSSQRGGAMLVTIN